MANEPQKASGNDLLDVLRGIRWRLTLLLIVAVVIWWTMIVREPWPVRVISLPSR